VPHISAGQRAQLKVLVAVAVPAWGRTVIAILGSAVVAHAIGLGDLAGFAVIPGVFMALSPPVGRLFDRLATVGCATVVVAVMSLLGAQASRATVWIVVGLALAGLVLGLLPRAGPRAAAMQLPLLMGFAYSAGHPLSEASAGSRALVVLAALPVYLLAVAVLFQPDSRRPLLLGAAAAMEGIATSLGYAAGGSPGAWRPAEAGLVRFRLATARVKDSAVPTGNSPDARAARLLIVSVQEAAAAARLIAHVGQEAGAAGGGSARPGADEAGTAGAGAARRERVFALSAAARRLAGALAGGVALVPEESLDELVAAARSEGDRPGAALAQALSRVGIALACLRGRSGDLPDSLVAVLPGPLTRLRFSLTKDDPAFRRAVCLAVACALAGLIPSLLGLGRPYWAVFAAVVVLNAPAAQDRHRALLRIGGTIAGLLLSLPLVALADGNAAAGLAIGLLALLPGLLLMPVNYGAAMVFITSAVGCLFAAGGNARDFLAFRFVDNLIGVAVIGAIGLVLWHTSRADWWFTARLTVRSLASAARSTAPQQYRDELVTRALQLRTETIEAAALPGTSQSFAAAWTFVAAAEDLMRLMVGPEGRPLPDPAGSVRRLGEVENRCQPGPAVKVPAAREASTAAAASGASGAEEPIAQVLADSEIERMAAAVALLHEPA
jgi:hypothetical protein